jgi:hypothetical protein
MLLQSWKLSDFYTSLRSQEYDIDKCSVPGVAPIPTAMHSAVGILVDIVHLADRHVDQDDIRSREFAQRLQIVV